MSRNVVVNEWMKMTAVRRLDAATISHIIFHLPLTEEQFCYQSVDLFVLKIILIR